MRKWGLYENYQTETCFIPEKVEHSLLVIYYKAYDKDDIVRVEIRHFAQFGSARVGH